MNRRSFLALPFVATSVAATTGPSNKKLDTGVKFDMKTTLDIFQKDGFTELIWPTMGEIEYEELHRIRSYKFSDSDPRLMCFFEKVDTNEKMSMLLKRHPNGLFITDPNHPALIKVVIPTPEQWLNQKIGK